MIGPAPDSGTKQHIKAYNHVEEQISRPAASDPDKPVEYGVLKP